MSARNGAFGVILLDQKVDPNKYRSLLGIASFPEGDEGNLQRARFGDFDRTIGTISGARLEPLLRTWLSAHPSHSIDVSYRGDSLPEGKWKMCIEGSGFGQSTKECEDVQNEKKESRPIMDEYWHPRSF